MRHWCDHNDGLAKYGWSQHDGKHFGVHDVYENKQNGFWIRNSWVKRYGGKYGGDWTVRTRVESSDASNQRPSLVSIIFYFATEYTGWIKSVKASSKSHTLSGATNDLGTFKIRINTNDLSVDKATGNVSLVHLKDHMVNNGYFGRHVSKASKIKEYFGFVEEAYQPIEDSNFIAYQITGTLPFEFDILFESDSLREEFKKNGHELKELPELKGDFFEKTLNDYQTSFVDRFETTFMLKDKQFSPSAISMAQATLSNVLGGIGFFTGQSIVKSQSNKEPVLYWSANLYTAGKHQLFIVWLNSIF